MTNTLKTLPLLAALAGAALAQEARVVETKPYQPPVGRLVKVADNSYEITVYEGQTVTVAAPFVGGGFARTGAYAEVTGVSGRAIRVRGTLQGRFEMSIPVRITRRRIGRAKLVIRVLPRPNARGRVVATQPAQPLPEPRFERRPQRKEDPERRNRLERDHVRRNPQDAAQAAEQYRRARAVLEREQRRQRIERREARRDVLHVGRVRGQAKVSLLDPIVLRLVLIEGQTHTIEHFPLVNLTKLPPELNIRLIEGRRFAVSAARAGDYRSQTIGLSPVGPVPITFIVKVLPKAN